MPLLEERLRSRFEWGLIVDIQPPDYETRLAILQSKARLKGINIPSEILEMIARDIQSNVRVLEGSLNRVIALSRLLKTNPTIEIANKALEDVASKEYLADDISPISIIEAVAESFQLSREILIGRRRDKDTSLARRLAMYLIRQETNFSLAQIGQELGNRDAASVTAACKKIAGDINDSPFLKRRISDIKRHLQPKAFSKTSV
jgi:chromosomal replication initiator protein